LGTEEDKLMGCRLFVHAAWSTRWKVILIRINFDINAGRSIEKHAVKCRILGSKVTCARTMDI